MFQLAPSFSKFPFPSSWQKFQTLSRLSGGIQLEKEEKERKEFHGYIFFPLTFPPIAARTAPQAGAKELTARIKIAILSLPQWLFAYDLAQDKAYS